MLKTMINIRLLLQRISLKKLLLTLFIILLLGLYFYFIHPHVTFENFQKNKDLIQSFVTMHYNAAVVIYCLVYITIITLALPAALILSLIGGFLFGTFAGALLVIISATTGAAFSFLIARYYAGNYIQNRYRNELKNFNEEMKNYGTFYLILVHFFPFIPFFVLNILCALTQISLTTFIVTTALGIAPNTLLYTALGHQLATVDKHPIHSITIAIILMALALLSLGIFIIIRKAKDVPKK
jgi:uncharacterized membrane protein YdjX (TVP38/TMEM64 family)